MSRPQPTASGTLEKTPLAHVLLTLLRRNLSGTLALWPGEKGVKGQDRILIEAGKPVGAVLLEGAGSLERGLLPLFHRKAGPWAFYPTDLIGEHPKALRGEADPYLILAASLRGGARSEVIDGILARWGKERIRVRPGSPLGRFHLVSKEKAFLEVMLAEPQSAQRLISTSPDTKVARRMLYLLTITGCVEHFAGDFVSVSLTEAMKSGRLAKEMFSRGPSSDGEPLDLEAIMGAKGSKAPPSPSKAPSKAPSPSKAPTAQTPEAPAETEAGAEDDFPLPDLPGLPDMDAAPAPAAPAPPPPPVYDGPSAADMQRDGVAPPPGPSGHLDADAMTKWRQMADFAVEIDRLNYFEMLDLPTDAGENAVREAYFKLVKVWHPDRIPQELLPLKPWIETVFHYLTEANATLSDEEKRKAYIKTVQNGGGTPEGDRRLALVLEAALEFEKFPHILRTKNYELGLTKIDELLEVAPDEADYHAMKGLLLFRQSGGKDQSVNEQALACLDKAIAQHSEHKKALFTKAQICQRLGRDDEAFELFKKVIELDPKNRDAERQVRIYTMRASKPTKKDDDGGFLGKLFGRRKK